MLNSHLNVSLIKHLGLDLLLAKMAEDAAVKTDNSATELVWFHLRINKQCREQSAERMEKGLKKDNMQEVIVIEPEWSLSN